jgi:hypothetical protein
LLAEYQRSILIDPDNKEKDDVMRVFSILIIVSILLMVAAPVWSDGAMHVILCDQDEDVTDDQVEVIAAEWFKAAKTVKGGENLEFYLNFPVAAKSGEVDMAMMLIAPSFGEWGTFMDNYPGSAAEDVDDKYEDELDCGDGTLWESMKVE